MILFGGCGFIRPVIHGVTPSDIHTLGATLGIPDKSGAGLAIHRPSPGEDTLLWEVFHKIGFFRQAEGVFCLADLWSVRY